MVQEISRVLKPGGYAIFMIPQTSVIHLAPDHYCNFTRYWILKAMKRAGLKVVTIKPIGGLFSSIASDMVFFFLKSFRYEGTSEKINRRRILFYILWPMMCVYALISIPILMLFSFGDLTEEPNNNLVIVRK
jgi:hypothetical protein